MSLTTCKNCKKIISSSDDICPYCARPNLGDTAGKSGSNQWNIRNVVIGIFALAILILGLVQFLSRNDESNETKPDQASNINASADSVSPIKLACLSSECPAGTKAVTYTTQQEPFYTCNSNELSEYANYVLGLMVRQDLFAEIPPKVSSKTGEPVVEGIDKSLLDKYREKAGVASFEEAISKCYRGRGNLNVVVLYNPKESNSVYVAPDENPEKKFWLPKARLYKK